MQWSWEVARSVDENARISLKLKLCLLDDGGLITMSAAGVECALCARAARRLLGVTLLQRPSSGPQDPGAGRGRSSGDNQ